FGLIPVFAEKLRNPLIRSQTQRVPLLLETARQCRLARARQTAHEKQRWRHASVPNSRDVLELGTIPFTTARRRGAATTTTTSRVTPPDPHGRHGWSRCLPAIPPSRYNEGVEAFDGEAKEPGGAEADRAGSVLQLRG